MYPYRFRALHAGTWIVALLSLFALLSPAASASDLRGEYSVVAVRKASDVAGGPVDASIAGIEIGSSVVFSKTLQWFNGVQCDAWSVQAAAMPVATLADPNLSDTQVIAGPGNGEVPDHRLNRHLNVTCDGKVIIGLVQVDQQVLIVPSRSGISYLILERRLEQDLFSKIEQALMTVGHDCTTEMKTPVSDTRRAVALLAYHLGARYAFDTSPITENLLEAFDLHELLPNGDRE